MSNEAPKSAADYQSAALTAIKTQPKAPANAPSPVVPPVADTVQSDVGGKPVADAQKEAPKEAPKEEGKFKPPSETIAKSFERMAKERAANRQEAERLKSLQGLEQRLGPQGVHALLQAQQKGDIKGILSALGVKPGDVQFEAAKDEVEEIKSEGSNDPRYDELKREFEALKQERQQERLKNGRARTLETVKELAKDPKYQYVNEFEGHAEALQLVEEYIRAHNEMPAETREESLRLGLDLVEEKYKAQAEKWSKVLTKSKPGETIPTIEASAQSPQVASEETRSLANTSSPAPVRSAPEPKSQDDYIAATLKAIKQFPQR